jgi:uncharacterized low-complexity protein
MTRNKKPLAVVLGAAFALTGAAAQASVFQATDLGSGYMVAAAGDDKAGEQKCGEKKGAEMGQKNGADNGEKKGHDKAAEGKCGEGKCGEGKCAANKKKEGGGT